MPILPVQFPCSCLHAFLPPGAGSPDQPTDSCAALKSGVWGCEVRQGAALPQELQGSQESRDMDSGDVGPVALGALVASSVQKQHGKERWIGKVVLLVMRFLWNKLGEAEDSCFVLN